MHREATLVALICPDDTKAFHCGFVDAPAVRLYISEMQPRGISVVGVSSADEKALQELLWQGAREDDRIVEMLRMERI